MTFKEWMLKEFEDQELKDVVTHGVDGGFSGLTYYTETVKLFEEHKDEIFDKLADLTEERGYDNIFELLATFNKNHMPWNYDQFANQLVWFMAEETAREILSDNNIEI
jgi:hypothetical protein